MEYDENNEASGSIPEFGAIFLSSIHSNKECFRRQMFALPSSKAEFVKRIKAGMVLFLFESEKRQLFGVYQASSDGAMNIVPNAFTYPGRHFPAQVCFTPIWHCYPLSENEFRDAIRENYFSAKKFSFGLSKDQVHRLLYLFSSRKLKNKMPPPPRAEAISGVAGKGKRLVGEDRRNSSERGYMEPAEYDASKPATFYDYRVNSLGRVKEEEVFINDRVNTEEKVSPFAEGDFLSKRRRIGKDDRLTANDVAENGIYNHCTRRTFHIDSPKKSLDEVRNLADARGFLTVERLMNENQVDEIVNPVLSSEHPADLDVRTADGYMFMQRSRLFDEYNGSVKVFASDSSGKSLGESKDIISDDGFFLDDYAQRGYNIRNTVIPMAHGDGSLNSHRQAREMVDDHDCFMDRKLEYRYHFDNGGSPVSAFEHSATLLHNIRKTTAAGAFPINENEPDLGACSLQEFSPENISLPLQHGHRIIHDRKYPVEEGRVTENMVDSILCSARNAVYNASVDKQLRQVVRDGRFRKIERVNEDTQTLTDPVMSVSHPSFSQLKGNLSSISGNLSPENRLSQFPVSDNFDVSCSKFDDATITRAVPYLPEHPNFSHGYSVSMGANQNSRLVRENHPHTGSLGNFYSQSSDRSPLYFPESKKSDRPPDMTSEYGNKGFSTSKSRDQRSSLHESTSSFINSNLSMHMDLDTSIPVNYGGSLFSNPSPHYNDLENIGEKGLPIAYPYKSRDHFSFDGNLPTASQSVSKLVAHQDADMLAGKDFICSEANDLDVGICHHERDLKGHGNQHFRFSSNMKLKELHKNSEAPHANCSPNRRSVFTRLTSREESHASQERNDCNLDCDESYMEATADEVMKMLQSDNLLMRKLGKSRVVGQPKHGENAVNEKKVQSHIETSCSKMEKKTQNDASLATADSIDEVPKETRVTDFKRRSDRRKIFIGLSADSATNNEITSANEDIKSSMKTTLKRKKLVRPVFNKTESASDHLHSNETLGIPTSILDKDDGGNSGRAISICKAEMPNDSTRLANVLASDNHEPVDCNNKEHPNLEKQMDVVADIFPSTNCELKEHKPTVVDLQIGSSQVSMETTQQKSLDIQTSVDDILAKDIDTTTIGLNPHQSSLEGFKPDIFPSTRRELKEHKPTVVDLQIGSSQVSNETTQQKSLGIQTSVEDILAKDIDTTTIGLNPHQSSPEGFKPGAGSGNNLVAGKRLKMLKSKNNFIRTSKAGTRSSQ